MSFYIVNKKHQPLSSFDSNNLVTPNQLKFRKRDCMSFGNREEAQRTLDSIVKNCRQQKQSSKLFISDDCIW